MRLKLDQDVLGLSSLMERMTGARVKDCFKDESTQTIYFIVAPGELGKAVGKGGANVHRLQNELGKRIKIVEYREEISQFIKNIIYPLTVAEVVEEENQILLKDSNKKTKSLLIGREGRNLILLNRAVQRFFNKEVKIV